MVEKEPGPMQNFPVEHAVPAVDPAEVREQAKHFQELRIGGKTVKEGLGKVLGMIDLTTLKGTDTPGKIRQLCSKVLYWREHYEELPHVAAVCVYPSLVKVAKEALQGVGVSVASVVGSFPSGQTSPEVKACETRYAVEEGADEVDMVISRGKFLSGQYQAVHDEVAAVKEACGKAELKVILETGELRDLNEVRMASEIAIQAGAGFIKTSTGKIQPGATFPASLVMLQTIRDHYNRTGRKVGMKPSGGISDVTTALRYLVMLEEILGKGWMTSALFRFGASRLAEDVIAQFGPENNKTS